MTEDGVPIIDGDRLHTRETQADLDRACREWGFFQLINHAIEPAEVERIMSASRMFFGQPIAAKRLVARTATNSWGFNDHELTKNTQDWKQIFDFGPEEGATLKPQWPADLPGFRDAALAWYAACQKVAFRLLEAIAVNLGTPADALSGGFTPAHSSYLRLNYYPRCPQPERPEGVAVARFGHLGINHHTDAGAITVLLQDSQPGLEVFRDGRWLLVEPLDGAVVVNIGDIVQVWSNDRYPAPLHRVIASPDAERFSIAFFFNPAYQTDYAPLKSLLGDAQPARYRPINWGEFRGLRSAGDYADYGEEVQISQYRI